MINNKRKIATMETDQNENGNLVPGAPIDVYCKLINGEKSNQSNIKIQDKKTLVLTPVDSFYNDNMTKKGYYVFKRVFHKQTSLKKVFDCVALPLVQDVLLGKNGLIYINGALRERNQVLLGTLEDIGILFRITDVIFNSINYYHATKFLFKPNGFNNFEVQSVPEALQEQQKRLSIFNIKPKYIMDSGQEWKNRILDSRTVDELDYDAKFSVFVSYIEICDHSIYDLLEDFDTGMIRTNAKSKVLVEDSLCNPYVHDINKVEVRSSDEVSQLLFHGQHKLTSGMDTHYKTSSHSIFTIYIVQALFDPFDSEILKDERAITVSQLSIVELGFCGMPSAFAAKNENFVSPENSNTPLSVLMKCFDAYRKSETQGGSKLIPYHENELTYLIKSYFDGKGKMKMIICMNEGYDYKKIMYLLQFATTKKKTKKSWSSSTLWSRSSSSWASKDEALFQKAISKLPDNKNLRHEQSSTNGLNWACPPSVIKSSSDDVVYLNLIGFLNEKMCHTKPLLQNLENQRANLKNNLVAIVQENEELKEATKALQMNLESKTELVIELEKKVSVIDNVKEELEKKISALRNQVDSIKLEVKKKDVLISEQDEKLRKIESNVKEKLELERNCLKSTMEKRLFKKQIELERKMCIKNKQFKMFKEIVNEKNQEDNELCDTQLTLFSKPSFATSMSVSEAKSKCSNLSSVSHFSTLIPRFCKSKINLDSVQNVITQSDVSLNNNPILHFYKNNQVKTSHAPKRSPVVANVRHQKSHVGGGGLWIVHEPKKCLYSSNILKPNKKKTKSFCNLELKDILKSKASKYALQYQEQTFSGETETYLFKADITQTIGGGVQVIFNDIEIVKREPPPCMF